MGLPATALSDSERALLERLPPRAVILFSRNITSLDQTRTLAGEIRHLPGPPLLCVDQEGGPVDRLRAALTPSISFREAAQRGAAARAGELAGEACALFGLDVDLAPVVDRHLPGRSERVLRDRCAFAEPEEIGRAALEFLKGLHARGVGGCVKHFPGLGRADLDTHRDLPRIPADGEEARRDLLPFAATMEAAGAVMVSHAAGPEGSPASLSRAMAEGVLRGELGFTGAAFSDDLEMGALAAFGDLPRRCVLAADAGCDLLLVCSRIDRYEECVAAVERDVPEARRAQAAERLDAYAEGLLRIRKAARIPERPVEELIADINALRERGRLA